MPKGLAPARTPRFGPTAHDQDALQGLMQHKNYPVTQRHINIARPFTMASQTLFVLDLKITVG